jgi:hypothetical protein
MKTYEEVELSDQLHASAHLPPGTLPLVLIGQEGECGPQSRSGRRGEDYIFNPTGTRTPTPQSSRP